ATYSRVWALGGAGLPRRPCHAARRRRPAPRAQGGAGPPRRARGAARGGRVARRGAGRAQGDRAGEGATHGEGRPLGARCVRAPPQGVSGVGPAAESGRGSRCRDLLRVTLTHQTRPARGEPEGVLVLLPGRGSDEHDLFPLLDVLDPEQRVLGVTPRGPLALPPGGAHWYAFYRMGYPDPDTFSATFPRLADWVDGLGCPPERTVIGGVPPGGVWGVCTPS